MFEKRGAFVSLCLRLGCSDQLNYFLPLQPGREHLFSHSHSLCPKDSISDTDILMLSTAFLSFPLEGNSVIMTAPYSTPAIPTLDGRDHVLEVLS